MGRVCLAAGNEEMRTEAAVGKDMAGDLQKLISGFIKKLWVVKSEERM